MLCISNNKLWPSYFFSTYYSSYRFSNADCVGCPNTRINLRILHVHWICILWSDKKQPCFSLKCKSRISFHGSSSFRTNMDPFSFSWYRSFLSITTYFVCDNLSALYLTTNPVFHAWAKHVLIWLPLRTRKDRKWNFNHKSYSSQLLIGWNIYRGLA